MQVDQASEGEMAEEIEEKRGKGQCKEELLPLRVGDHRDKRTYMMKPPVLTFAPRKSGKSGGMEAERREGWVVGGGVGRGIVAVAFSGTLTQACLGGIPEAQASIGDQLLRLGESRCNLLMNLLNPA